MNTKTIGEMNKSAKNKVVLRKMLSWSREVAKKTHPGMIIDKDRFEAAVFELLTYWPEDYNDEEVIVLRLDFDKIMQDGIKSVERLLTKRRNL